MKRRRFDCTIVWDTESLNLIAPTSQLSFHLQGTIDIHPAIYRKQGVKKGEYLNCFKDLEIHSVVALFENTMSLYASVIGRTVHAKLD